MSSSSQQKKTPQYYYRDLERIKDELEKESDKPKSPTIVKGNPVLLKRCSVVLATALVGFTILNPLKKNNPTNSTNVISTNNIEEDNRQKVINYLEVNPIYPNTQTSVSINFYEFDKVYERVCNKPYSKQTITIEAIEEVCSHFGEITPEELELQLKSFGSIDYKEKKFRPEVPTAKFFLRTHISKIDREIMIYESYVEYILTASRTMDAARQNDKYSLLLLGRHVSKNDIDVSSNNLLSQWEQLKSFKNVYSNEKYLEELKKLVREYTNDLDQNEVSLADFIEYSKTLPLPPIQINPEIPKKEIIYDIETIVARNEWPLCKEVDITYTITKGDNSLSSISERLRKEGLYITPAQILKRTKDRYPEGHLRILGDYDATPQSGATFNLKVLTELPIEEQEANIREAFIKYLGSNDDFEIRYLLDQWNWSLSEKDREKLWHKIYQSRSDEFNTFCFSLLNEIRKKYELPASAFVQLGMSLGTIDYGYDWALH